MFRLWGKEFKENRLLRDTVIWHAKARFYQDNFVDSIDFDYLEIEVIEE